MISVAYAEVAPTVPMTVMRTCSLTVNGPGLIEMPSTLTLGTNFAQAVPRG